MTKGAAPRPAYARAGVDVAAGERAVELMRPAIERTRRPELVGGLGGFAGAIAVPAGYREPLLVASTDGIGTKAMLAATTGRFDGVGADVVGMCADDVVCSGAEPLAFLDYLSVGRLVPEAVAAIVGSVADACAAIGCALVGGETAEHPGLMDANQFDLAGCCIGVVERSDLLDGTTAGAGDVLLGLAASGLHANGFSLVRALVSQWEIDLQGPYQALLSRTLGGPAADTALAAEPGQEMATVADVLLTPTRVYARVVLQVRAALRAAGHDLRGAAHITGGGLPGNLPRVLPDGLAARVDVRRWPMPSVMRLMGALGGLDDGELRATFNGGLGMVLVVPPDGVTVARGTLERLGVAAWEVGTVVPVATADGARYLETGTTA
ncbi:MAG TPA: phosphoribosylformylglycinamidine cyclo-ligase [Candidatus Limnocylindrales bacterium]